MRAALTALAFSPAGRLLASAIVITVALSAVGLAVGDVLLTRQDDHLVVVAVDVGFGSVMARLGLRRLSERAAEQEQAERADPPAEIHRMADERIRAVLDELMVVEQLDLADARLLRQARGDDAVVGDD